MGSSTNHSPLLSHTLPLPAPAPVSPRGGKDSVNDWVPHILGLLDKHILWGQKERELGGYLGHEPQGPAHSWVGGTRLPLTTHPAAIPCSSHRPPPACRVLTELVKVGLDAILAWHRADQPCLQECAPLVDQAAVAAVIVLGGRGQGLGQISSLTSKTLPEQG